MRGPADNAQGDPIVRRLGSGVDLLALHAVAPDRYPFLLQSTAPGGSLGRFDILFACPAETLVLPTPDADFDFLDALDSAWRRQVRPAGTSALPFTGGWFLYLGYELAGQVEPGLRLDADPVLPTAFAQRCRAALIYDHQEKALSLVREAGAEFDEQGFADDLRAAATRPAPTAPEAARVVEEAPAEFLDAVVQAREFIAAGDIYQANLSRAWTADVEADPVAIFHALSRSNPAPFAGLVRWQDTAIVSSSPERLLLVRDGMASTRPIAGTRPRGDDASSDDSLSAELFANEKERAEHVMLIDLERNDLGRVCVPGTVEVDEMMVLESYAHVHHIVSNVRGKLRDGVTPGAAVRAVFPGGTITGCPKVRCMQIIAALESGPRGAYTGSIGYLGLDGSLDLNIMIRTMVMQDHTISFRAGSGIVADSDPAAELEETRAKAKGLLRALAS